MLMHDDIMIYFDFTGINRLWKWILNCVRDDCNWYQKSMQIDGQTFAHTPQHIIIIKAIDK